MKRTNWLVFILNFSLLCMSPVAFGQRVSEANGKVVKLEAEQEKQLNTFFSNFSEVRLQPFREGEMNDETLIRFGILILCIDPVDLWEQTFHIGGISKKASIRRSIYFGQ
ncbi:MAG TPA: hypothetical protein DDW65_19455 [Firmicutes bacterium]|jgi:hypothetical protein|nr:hypothetical protein [Bacillota bacterium]